MKVCIPAMGEQGMKEAVHGHFGSAKFFYLYDSEKGDIQKVKNENDHHSHGMCQPLSSLDGKGVDAVLTAGIGRRALQILNDRGITVYRL